MEKRQPKLTLRYVHKYGSKKRSHKGRPRRLIKRYTN